MKSNLNNWVYIFQITEDGCLTYERTKERVKELEDYGYEAFYTIGTLTKEPWFY